MQTFVFNREATENVPAGMTVSKRDTLPEGDFGITEYRWPDLTLWFVDADEFTADERRDAYMGTMEGVGEIVQIILEQQDGTDADK